MTCPTEREWNDYVEGECPAERERELAQHLADCAHCAERAGALARERALLVAALAGRERRGLALPPAARWAMPLAAAVVVCLLALMARDLRRPAPPRQVAGDSRSPAATEPLRFRTVDSARGLPVLRLVGRMAIQAPGDDAWRPAVAGERLPWGGRIRVAADSAVELGLRDGRIRLGGSSRLAAGGSDAAPELRLDRGRAVVLAGERRLPLTLPSGVVELAGAAAVDVPHPAFATVQVERGEARLPGERVVGPRHEGLLGRVPGEWLAELSDAAAARYRALSAVTSMLLDSAPIAAWQRGLDAPRPRGDSSVGMLVTRDEQGREAEPLAIAACDVRLRLAGNVALTRVEQSFRNDTGRVLEGTFYFPLPPGAAISRFAMVVDSGELVEGEVVERARARAIYASILREERDPALLEWMSGNTFKTRIFPIQPRSEKKIILEYTQLLPAFHGVLRYRYALVSDLARKRPIGRFSFEARLQGAGEVRCPTLPEARIAREGQATRIDWSASDLVPQQDVLLLVRRPAAAASLVTSRDPQRDAQSYFALSLVPSGGGAPSAERRPGAYVFCVDTSASIEPGDLERQLAALRLLLGELAPADRAAVLAVDVAPRDLTRGLVHPGGPRIAAALQVLAGTPALGATDLGAALQRGVDLLASAPEGARRTLVYLGDGVASFGETGRAALLERFGRAFARAGVQMHALAAGRSIDRLLLEGLSRTSGGAFLALETDDETSDGLYAFALAIGESLWSGVELQLEGAATSQVYPSRLGSLIPGQEVIVLGRIAKPAPLQVTLRGHSGGQPVSRREEARPTPASPEQIVLGRFWAMARVEALLAGPQSKAARDEVLALAREWTLVTPYSSFLVLESESEYARYDIDRAKRRRYWPEEARPARPLVRSVPLGRTYYDPFTGREREALPEARAPRLAIALLAPRPVRREKSQSKGDFAYGKKMAQEPRSDPGQSAEGGDDEHVRRLRSDNPAPAKAPPPASSPALREALERNQLPADRGHHSFPGGTWGKDHRGRLDSDLKKFEELTDITRSRKADGYYRRALKLYKQGDLAGARWNLSSALRLGWVAVGPAAPGALIRLGPAPLVWEAFGVAPARDEPFDGAPVAAGGLDPLAHLLRFHHGPAAPAARPPAAAQALLAGRALPARLRLVLVRDGRRIELSRSEAGLELQSGDLRLVLRHGSGLALFDGWGVAVQGVPAADVMARAIQGVAPFLLDTPADLARRFEITQEPQTGWFALADRRNRQVVLRAHLDPQTRLVDRIEVLQGGGLAYRLERSELREVEGYRYYARTVLRTPAGRVLSRTRVEQATAGFTPAAPLELLAVFRGQLRRYPTGDLQRHDATTASGAFHRGLVLLEQGKPAEALDAFSAAVRLQPQAALYRFYRAYSAIRVPARQSARAEMVDVLGGDLARMLGAAPRLARAARLLFVQGALHLSPRERLAAYRRVPLRGWRDHRTRAYLASAAGQAATAADAQRKAVETAPAALRDVLSIEQALYLFAAGQRSAAAAVLRAVQPKTPGPLAAVAWARYTTGDPAGAAKLYRRALDETEDRPLFAERAVLFSNLAVCLAGEASYRALIEGYGTLARRSPAAAYRLLERMVRLLQHEPDAALLERLRAATTEPRLRSLLTRRQAVLERDRARAAALWLLAYEESGRDARLLHPLAAALLADRQHRRLSALLEGALLAGARASWIEATLQQAYAADGGPAWRLARLSTCAIERAPAEAAPRRAYAALLERQGRTPEAIAQLRLAAKFRPEDASNPRDVLRLARKSGDLASREWAALFMLDGSWLSREGDVWGEAERELQALIADHRGAGNAAKAAELERRARALRVKALVVRITWDSATDVDLHVVEPGNHRVSYNSRTSFRGGVLDHDDTDGHGPETYTLKRGSPGRFQISVKLYSAKSHRGPTSVTITVWRNQGGESERKQVYVKTLERTGQVEQVLVVQFPK